MTTLAEQIARTRHEALINRQRGAVHGVGRTLEELRGLTRNTPADPAQRFTPRQDQYVTPRDLSFPRTPSGQAGNPDIDPDLARRELQDVIRSYSNPRDYERLGTTPSTDESILQEIIDNFKAHHDQGAIPDDEFDRMMQELRESGDSYERDRLQEEYGRQNKWKPPDLIW